jgi:hypothetical protein
MKYTIEAAESACNLPCDGNSEEMCGGNNHMSVYQVGGTPDSEALSAQSSSYTYGYGPTATNLPTYTAPAPKPTVPSTVFCPAANGTSFVSNGKGFNLQCGKSTLEYLAMVSRFISVTIQGMG